MKLLSKIIFLLIPFMFLSGCFTMSPEESRKLYFNMPEQKLCVDYINYPSYNYYQPYRAEAISNRKIDCNKYLGIASAKAQQDREFDAAVQDVIKGIEKIETGNSSTSSSTSSSASGSYLTYILDYHYLSGPNRICVYKSGPYKKTTTIPSTSRCLNKTK